MKVETAGFNGWAPVQFFDGKAADGSFRGTEGFRNVMNGQEVRPENGWDGEPPYPTGDLSNCRHVSEKYRKNYDLITWGNR